MLLATLRLFAGECFRGLLLRVPHVCGSIQHSIRTMSTIFSLGEGCRFKDATNSVGRGETMDWELRLGPVPLSHTISVWPWSRAGAEGKDLRGVSLVR